MMREEQLKEKPEEVCERFFKYLRKGQINCLLRTDGEDSWILNINDTAWRPLSGGYPLKCCEIEKEEMTAILKEWRELQQK